MASAVTGLPAEELGDNQEQYLQLLEQIFWCLSIKDIVMQPDKKKELQKKIKEAAKDNDQACDNKLSLGAMGDLKVDLVSASAARASLERVS